MLNPHSLYTVVEAAHFFKVSKGSVYQSLPEARCRPKLGRKLPEPIRIGRLLRWTGQQLIDFISTPSSEPAISNQTKSVVVKGPRVGRPRKVQN